MRIRDAWRRFRAQVKEKRHPVLVWGSVGCFLLLSFLAVLGDGGFLEVYEFGRHLERVEAQIRALERENVELRAVISALQNDPYTMEKLARKELGLARPDELIFEIFEPAPSPE
ncbi:MAG: septum formation initiator family protein [Nitrospinae bacterium]|nr:septum formation initiator family protein [Nitrospinota bacterium]